LRLGRNGAGLAHVPLDDFRGVRFEQPRRVAQHFGARFGRRVAPALLHRGGSGGGARDARHVAEAGAGEIVAGRRLAHRLGRRRRRPRAIEEAPFPKRFRQELGHVANPPAVSLYLFRYSGR
jgi:hypothetical protein